jgi:uncharacterized protein with HEPN domain
MLEAILDIEQITTGRSFEAYGADRPTRRAVERCIEIVSEASRRLPPGLKASHPEVPWQKVAGIGNVLRHDYDVVNNATIWHAATIDLLPLKAAVQDLLREIEADEP